MSANDTHAAIVAEKEVFELRPYRALELICFPGRRSHKPVRDWKKSQKKIRREKRQRGYRK